MFYSQCWTCGERWELGTASTCKCPDETAVQWTEMELPSPVFTLSDTKPSHNITFYNGDKQMGALDFNGPEMTFSGDMDESAKLFFDFIAKSFKARLEQERADERELCAKVADKVEYCGACESDVARAIRAMGSRAVGNRAYDRYEGDNT